MRRALLSLAGLVVLATTASCLSPTLPLPPPDHPDAISQGANGLWQISGTCDLGAFVTVFNNVSHRGDVVEDVARIGSYHVTIPGNACDSVWVWQETLDGGKSTPTSFVLQNWSNGAPVGPTACP